MDTTTTIGTVTPPALEVRNIRQAYFNEKTGKEHVVFENFSLAIEDYHEAGQFPVIMGPSGCGKSTLLRYWSNLQQPTAGEIYVHGKPLEPHQSIPMVFQQYSSLEWLTVLQNVALPLTLKGVPKKEAYEKAMHMIKVVGLEGHEHKYAKAPNLSGGQLQRVAIARSLVANPAMLFLDEPFGALDGYTRTKMQFFLLDLFHQSELANINPTVVLVTHDPREAVLLGEDIYILANGQVKVRVKPDLPNNRDRSIRQNPRFIEFVNYIETEMENVVPVK
jgi:NitT/TauT family transport system ATP-binding protein